MHNTISYSQLRNVIQDAYYDNSIDVDVEVSLQFGRFMFKIHNGIPSMSDKRIYIEDDVDALININMIDVKEIVKSKIDLSDEYAIHIKTGETISFVLTKVKQLNK